MSLVGFARREMKLAKVDKETQELVLLALKDFAEERHSGASAAYATAAMRPRTKAERIFKQLASFTALTPLTGAPSEWMLIEPRSKLYQNRRCASVLKEAGRAYDIDSRPTYIEPSGAMYTSSKDVPPTIKFPYDVAAEKKKRSRRKPKRVKEEDE